MFLLKIGNKKRLLRLPYPSVRTLLHRPFMTAHHVGRNVRVNGVQSHHAPFRAVYGQADHVHLRHTRKPMGQIVHHGAHVDQAGNRL